MPVKRIFSPLRTIVSPSIIFKVGEVVSTLHHHFDQVHEHEQETKEILVNMKDYIK